MDKILNFLKMINREAGELTAQMDTGAWIALSAITVVLGFFLLRGNIIKGA